MDFRFTVLAFIALLLAIMGAFCGTAGSAGIHQASFRFLCFISWVLFGTIIALANLLNWI